MTSKTKPRSNLEIFLLALVQAGVHTPYDLMSKASISLGSSLPALSRLERDGLLRVSSGLSRGSRVFTTTEKGTAVLDREWRIQLKATRDDLDSILRTASMACVSGQAKECSRFLKEAGARLKGRLKKEGISATAPIQTRASTLQDQYRWLRKSVEVARRKAEIAALFELSREISPE